MKDTNKFVNNKDFGVIARSSRGSNTPTQVGDQNQRENFNANRDRMATPRDGKPRTYDSMQGRGDKVTKDVVTKSMAGGPYSQKYQTTARKNQRSGGKGK